jgi:hypothetical protein
MKTFILLCAIMLSLCSVNLAQTESYNQSVQIENISEKLTSIAKSLDQLNEKLKTFAETFSSNQGLRLTERQQTVLIAFEFLNRAEQRLATLQKLKIEMTEKQTSVQVKLAENEENLRSESIDRTLGGTTNAEELRNIRRRVLSRERSDLSSLLAEIEATIRETDSEIKNTEMFLRRIRQRIFPAIDKELSDL